MRHRSPLAALVLALLPLPAPDGETAYVVESAASSVKVHVGKTGLFSFAAGHEHEVVAPVSQGRVMACPEDLSRSSVSLSFGAGALRVTGEGEPAADVPKVQARMVGPDALDVARFPTITFASRTVSGRLLSPGVYELVVIGDFGLHGVSRSVRLPMRVEVSGGALTAAGRTVLKHTDFGMRPISVAGVVKVKNDVAIDYKIVAKATP